jgi:predicted PurR-regulated permease PerM
VPAAVPRWLDVVAAWSWRTVVIAVAIALVGYVIVELRLVVIPLIVGVFLAALLMPLADRLERRTPLPRTVATLLVLLGALAAFAGVIWWLVPNFTDQVDELRGW